MANLSRVSLLFPFLCVAICFILSSLSVFSGWEGGFMEEYAIIRFNATSINNDGSSHKPRPPKDTKPQTNETAVDDEKDPKEEFDPFNTVSSNRSSKQNNSLTIEPHSQLIHNLAEDVEAADWYSLHLMNTCEGSFAHKVNSTSWFLRNITCTDPRPLNRFNLTYHVHAALRTKLPSESKQTDPASWLRETQDRIEIFNNVVFALFVLYSIGMGCCGIATLLSLCSGFSPTNKALVHLNLIFTCFGTFSLVIANMVLMVAVIKCINDINNAGGHIGVRALRGNKFLTVSWVLVCLMTCASGCWTSRFAVFRRRQRFQREKDGL